MITVNQFLLDSKKPTWIVSSNKSVREALILMKEKNIGCLIVVGDNQKLEGIFSERDYAIKCVLAGLNSQDTKIHQLMSKTLLRLMVNNL